MTDVCASFNFLNPEDFITKLSLYKDQQTITGLRIDTNLDKAFTIGYIIGNLYNLETYHFNRTS
jgi:hypothetical protein